MKGDGGKKEKKNWKRRSDGRGEGGEKEIVTDPRFASVHTDPRFQKIRTKERKVQIDQRFDKMFTDKDFGSSAAPVDKRGRRKEREEKPLKRYYELEEKEESEEEGRVKVGGGLKKKKKKKKSLKQYHRLEKREESQEEESQEEERVKVGGNLKKDGLDDEEEGVPSSDEEDDMEELSDVEIDTDDDEMLIGGSESESEEQEEEVPEIDQETSRLAAVNLDWHHIKAVDLYVLLNSFLPDGGRIRSVTVYPSEFGMERMKEEAVHGPVGLFDDDGKKSSNEIENDLDASESDDQNGNDEDSKDDSGSESEDGIEDRDGNSDENEEEDEDEKDEEEEDKDYINERVRNYEKTRLRYYFAVVCCDSVSTANHLYKECDGIEIMQSSNKLDLRYIPDSMEFKQEARDVATEVPSGYTPSNFFTKALQLSKPVLTWDEDEPERATLKRNFNADELEKLEFDEFLASDDSDTDSDEGDGVDNKPSSKKHSKVDAYRSLLLGGGADEDDDSDENDDGQDMEVTFNTGLEDISKRILEKRENKSETIWEAHLRKRKEKRKAKKSIKDSDNESDASDDEEEMDEFISDGPLLKKHKGEAKTKSNRKGTDKAEADREAGASRAELELLLADDKGTGANVKGYKIKPEKTKRKKGKELADDHKIPEADLDDSRFKALFKDPLYSLDPTDPQFKRSVAYRRQLVDKQKMAEQDALSAKDETRSSNQAQMSSYADVDSSSKPVPSSNVNALEISSLVKSIKMKSKEADKRGKSDVSAVSQSLKKKTKHLLN